MVADPLMAAANSSSTVFARWRQCTYLSNTRLLGPTRPIITNGCSIASAVFPEFTDRPTETDGTTTELDR